MSRKIPNQKKKYQELEKRINEYTLELERIFETLNAEAANIALTTSYDNTSDELFSFNDYPETKYRLQKLQERYVNDIYSLIYSSTSEEWMNSNLVCDLIADGVLKSYTGQVDRQAHTQYYQKNSPALKAFQQRRDRGMSISDKLWIQSKEYRGSLEEAISLAFERGTSAVTLSKQISKYLKDFPSMQKDYKEKYGGASTTYDCEYRAARLARTEINMAYRTAEQTRWKQMDFVLGYEVKLSNNHNCKGVPKGEFFDICDELAGKYPKDFKFVSWHPNCRCYTIPILKTEEQFFNDEPVDEIKDVPENFKQWIGANSYRIEKSEKKGTSPYFIRDNKQIVSQILSTNPVNVRYSPKLMNNSQKALWNNNITSIEEKLGIIQGKPMGFIEANKGRSNPLYGTSISYIENCQKCVISNELRRRGFDVEAFGSLGSFVTNTNESWINIVTGESPSVINVNGDSLEKFKLQMNGATKEDGRYHMYVQWNKTNAHIVTLERIKNRFRIYDAQNGKSYDIEYFFSNRMKNSPLLVYRVDDCLIVTENLDKIVKKYENR